MFLTTENIGSLFRSLCGDAALESGCKDGNENVTNCAWSLMMLSLRIKWI